MTDADKKLYDKAEELFCQNCKLRTEQCLFAYRKVNGIEDYHKSCGCKEVPAWIDGYNRGKEDVKYDLMMKLKDEGIVTPLKDSIFYNQRLSSQEQQELCSWIECAMDFGENLDEAVERIEKLEKIILKLRNCENCKYHSFWGDELKCNYGLKEALQEDKLVECHNLDKWEMKK